MSNSQLTYRFSVNPQGELPAAGNGDPVNSDSSLCLDDRYPDSLGADLLSIALIGPDEERRKAAAAALAGCQAGDVREFASYPASLDDVPMLLEQHYDVIAIDLDSNPEYALELVESICADGSATVMVYSVKTDLELPVRCMRAGAREFLTLPFAQSTMAEALIRVSARRRATRLPKKAGGRLLVFLGAKAGEGVTTIACNYAVALALESGQSTLLIDLNLPLGDAALNLGVVAEFSAINALQNFSRLDSSFLSKLLVKHSSGVSVLAAPGKFPQFEASNEAIDKLLAVAQQDFENVVVDVGSKLDFMGTALFKDGSTIYLVIQAGIAGLRNANRLISQYFTTRVPKLEIVINRFQPRSLGVAEDEITKALTRPVQWKIPNDYAAVRRMQHTAIPFALEDSPISRLIRQMARSACGLPTTPEKEKGTGFSLKSFSRSISARISTPEEAPAITQPGLAPGQDNAGAASGATQPDATANIPGNSVYTPPAGALLATETQTSFTPTETADRTGLADAKWEALPSAGAPDQEGEPETRAYKGATYVKGADGEWRLQQIQATVVNQETPAIAWPEPAPIAYGAALSATELNAAASVPGTFVYTPATGEVLAAGTYMLSVTFTPADAANYTTAQAAVSLAVTEATPAIAWPEPAPIAHGAALSATDLDAESQPAPAKAAPAQAEKPPAPQAKPAPRKAPAKAPAKPPVKADAEPPFEPPAKAPVENPAPESPVDVVSGLDLMGTAVFKDGTTIYLVMQPGAAGVDNANRLVSQYFTAGGPKPEVVIKRFESRLLGGAEDQTTTALVRSAHSPISRLIRQMARSASDLPATPEKEKMTGFSLKGFSRSIRAKISSAGKAQAITRLGLWSDQDNAGAAPGATQPDATANIPGNTVYTPPVGTVLAAEPQTPFTPTDIEDRAGAPDRQGEPETRNYKGATYVKGADGEWHLQETQTSEVNKETPAIAWPMPAPIADDTALSATELNAESQPAPAKAAPAQARKPAPQAKPAPRKAPAKAAAKPQAKAPARPPVKPPAKAATKPPAKAPAKPPVKTPAKAPAPKSAHAKGKPAPAANSKAGRVSHAAKPSKPAAKKPAPRPAKKR